MTSETATLSVPNAPSRPARADQAPAPDGFSALVEGAVSNPRSDDRATVTASDRPSPQQRPHDPSAASDCHDATTPASDRNNATSAPQPAEAAAGSGAAVSKPLKPDAAKPATGKTALKDAASEVVGTTDLLSSAEPVAQPAAAIVPVAVVIAAPVVPVAVSTPVSSDSARQPLAIAAAAIATTTSTIEASKAAAMPLQAATDPAAGPATTPATASPTTASPAAADPETAILDAPQAASNETAIAQVSPSAVKSDIPVQADPAVAAAVVASAPAAAISPKTAARAPAAPSADDAAHTEDANATGDADPSQAAPMTDKGNTPALQAPAPDGSRKPAGIAIESAKADTAKPDTAKPDATKPDTAKPDATKPDATKPDATKPDATKSDATKSDAPAAAATPHEHRALTAVQLQADAVDTGQIANAAQQPAQAAAPSGAAPQLSVTASTTAAVPLNGLALQIAVTAQSGRSRFEIRLDPAELGRIDVRIDLDRHGQITSHLTVEKPETLAMLRQDAPQLQRALDNAGFKTGDNGLQFSLRDQSSSGQHGGNEASGNAHRLIISEDDVVPVTIAGRTYGRIPGSGGGVDIRV
jgi:flagellar hook-length control protein FliK